MVNFLACLSFKRQLLKSKNDEAYFYLSQNNKLTDRQIEINLFHEGGTVHLSIKDFGVGMDSSEIQKMFTPFYSKFAFGIGLGMTIVKRIVDEHGFKMEIKSEKNLNLSSMETLHLLLLSLRSVFYSMCGVFVLKVYKFDQKMLCLKFTNLIKK